MIALPAPEILLCDTSYLGIVRAAQRRPYLTDAWPADVVARIAAATLAISVITVAEERAGEIYGGWGPRSAAVANNARKGFVWVPLDLPIVERWAALDAACRATGTRAADDNDFWIAATAIERDLTLVSCDKHQCAIPGLRSIYLPPGSATTPVV